MGYWESDHSPPPPAPSLAILPFWPETSWDPLRRSLGPSLNHLLQVVAVMVSSAVPSLVVLAIVAQFNVTVEQACAYVHVTTRVGAHVHRFTPVPLNLCPFLEWLSREGFHCPSPATSAAVFGAAFPFPAFVGAWK